MVISTHREEVARPPHTRRAAPFDAQSKKHNADIKSRLYTMVPVPAVPTARQRLPNKIIGLYGATPTKKAATNGPVTVPRPDGPLSQLSTVQLKVEAQT